MKPVSSVVVVALTGALCFLVGNAKSQEAVQLTSEATTGFDNQTNGFSEQGPPYESLNVGNVVALRSFNDNRFIFEEFETIEDGLGPVYNAQSCRECTTSKPEMGYPPPRLPGMLRPRIRCERPCCGDCERATG